MDLFEVESAIVVEECVLEGLNQIQIVVFHWIKKLMRLLRGQQKAHDFDCALFHRIFILAEVTQTLIDDRARVTLLVEYTLHGAIRVGGWFFQPILNNIQSLLGAMLLDGVKETEVLQNYFFYIKKLLSF